MVINTRSFLREFGTWKARARRGETIRVRDRAGEFCFTASSPRRTLLGAAQGKIMLAHDLDRPTLPPEAWKPSL